MLFDLFRKFLHRINWWIVNKDSSDKKLCFKPSKEFNDRQISIEKPFVFNSKHSNSQKIRFYPAVGSIEIEKTRSIYPDELGKIINLNVEDTWSFIKYITDYFDQLKPSLENLTPITRNEKLTEIYFGEPDTDNNIYLYNPEPDISPTNKSLPVNPNISDQLKFQAIKDEIIQALDKNTGELKVAVNEIPNQTVQQLEQRSEELKRAEKRIRDLEQDNRELDLKPAKACAGKAWSICFCIGAH